MERIHIACVANKVGKEIKINGWVDARRDHGKLIFLDIRDVSGILQVVVNPKVSAAAHKAANLLRSEFVVEVAGELKERAKNLVNSESPTGAYELAAKEIKVLSEAKDLPFEIEKSKAVNEETRLKYRYLDLRNKKMTENIKQRHQFTRLIRQYLNKKDFYEIETPLLTKTSPEGARDFLVPSRLQPGKFYALPQAPQQYKQLLMIAGFERYYQIAKALRDEDMRGDRQLEHTQIDMEMSFMSQDEILSLIEEMMVTALEGMGKKIETKPFPRITHEEALKKYGADRFDPRKEKNPDSFALAWVTDFPLFEKDEETNKLTFAHNPFSRPKDEAVQKLMAEKDLEQLRAQQYDLVCNGYEIASGGLRISDPKVQRKVFNIMGLNNRQIDERFGHILEAYEYGAPIHGGIAVGLDRVIMLLQNEETIREVIPFPVNSSGHTSVMDAPSEVEPKQLKDLHIKLDL